MVDIVEQMKAEVGNLLQGGQIEEQSGNGNGSDTPGIGGDADSNPGSISDGGNKAVDQLSERDQFELDKAKSSGWKEPDSWDGDPKDFVEPREWNRTVALYRRLDRQDEERRALKKEVASYGDRIKNVMEVAKATAMKELEEKKREAVESADYEEVRRIDGEIDKTNDEYSAPDVPETEQTLRPEVEDWMSENSWFEKDEAMTREALKIQRAQLMDLPDPANPTAEELRNALKETSAYIQFKFGDKLKRQPRAKAQVLEGSKPAPTGKKFTYNDLTAQERKVLGEIERFGGGMSRDAYIQAISDMRGAK